MFNKYLGVMAVATLCVALAGCDTVNDAINDALPEIGIADGFLGLNGESGVEMQGTFSALAAAKSGDIQTTASFARTESFADLNNGDVTKINAAATSLALMSLTLTRGTAATLPTEITITSGSVTYSVSDAGATLSGSTFPLPFSLVFPRASGCQETANSCVYSPTGLTRVILALLDLNQAESATLIQIIGQSTPSTPNSATVSVSLTLANPLTELQGMTATARVGEFNTTIQPVLF